MLVTIINGVLRIEVPVQGTPAQLKVLSERITQTVTTVVQSSHNDVPIPTCPQHGNTMEATDGAAVWECTVDGCHHLIH